MARVRYIVREDLPAFQRNIYDEMASRRGAKSVANVFRALLNRPEAAVRVSDLGIYLRFQSELSAEIRELVPIAVARELGCSYEWTHHERLARSAGISDASIAAIRAGRLPDGLRKDETVVVRYAQELLRSHSVTDDTFDAALEQLGTGGLIDLTLMVGYYAMVAFSILALNVELEEDLVAGSPR